MGRTCPGRGAHGAIKAADGITSDLYLSSVYAQRTTRSYFTRKLDGYEDGAGVHYKVTERMVSANFNGLPFATDIYDGNDSPHSNQYMYAQIEYICRPNDILSVFKFSPTVQVTSTNITVGMWIRYAQDEDNTTCDYGGPGEQWPPATQVTLPPKYAQSLATLHSTRTGVSYPPNTFAPLVDSAVCDPDYTANAVEAYGANGFPIGTWLRWGSSSTIDASQPRWQIIVLDVPGTGAGTDADPFRVPIQVMGIGNEPRDGQMGGGLGHGVNIPYVLQAGKWYQVYFQMQTKF